MDKKRMFVSKRKLGGARIFRKWSDWAEGDIMVFVLKGYAPSRKSKGQKDYIVDVVSVFFKDKKEEKRLVPNPKEMGVTMQLNHCGRFKNQMKFAKIGDTCQVTYNGSNVIKGGEWEGEESHLMEVEVGEMSDGSTGTYEAPEEEDDEFDGDEEEDDL